MTIPIEPLRIADMPVREASFWKMTGPGAIMMGLAIGSGELILWPWVIAKFGTEMIWVPLIGLFIQFWVNIEIGRWAVATGESAFTGFARISKFWVYFFITILLIGSFLPGWGREAGTSLKIILFGIDGPGADWFWTAIVTLLAIGILFGPKRIYTSVERSIAIMVLVIVIGMIIVAVNIGTWSDIVAIAEGFKNIGHIHLDEEFTFNRFFGAFVFAGLGGVGNLFYAYYLRDKGIGMGARIPALVNPLRQAEIGSSEIGYIFPENLSNLKRFREWFRFVKQDQIIFFWLGNTFTMLLFMFGALVVLFPKGIVPQENKLLWDLALMLEESMGTWGRYLFLIIGISALFSCVLTILDGCVRLWVDLLHTNFKWAQRFVANRMYLVIALGFSSLGVLSTWFFTKFDISVLDFFFISAMIGGFAMAVYVPMVLYMNLKYLPSPIRPSAINIIMVGIGALIYIVFSFYTLWTKVGSLFI